MEPKFKGIVNGFKLQLIIFYYASDLQMFLFFNKLCLKSFSGKNVAENYITLVSVLNFLAVSQIHLAACEYSGPYAAQHVCPAPAQSGLPSPADGHTTGQISIGFARNADSRNGRAGQGT